MMGLIKVLVGVMYFLVASLTDACPPPFQTAPSWRSRP